MLAEESIMSGESHTVVVDRLEKMWAQQHDFMKLLQQKRNFPSFPVDLTSKPGQKFIKGLMHECMDELHESLQHLKNAKDHRATEITSFDRAEFIEELCDSLHYFIEIAIASGVDLEELFEAYIAKGEVNKKRILKGY
jgi:hypothetical protein